MKRYTQEDFDSFEVVEGIKQCPSGDYSLIFEFEEQCSFAEECSFAEGCRFAGWCSFAGWCRFAAGCSFAGWCRFAAGCIFAEGCSFAKGCSIERHTLKASHVISVSGIGEYKRTLYVWITDDGIFCQAGCFFGSEDEFVIAVRKKYGEDSAYEQSLDLLKRINNESLLF